MAFSSIGKNVSRIDALEKVTGKAQYCGDIKFPGMLHAKVLRSRFPHAKILRIDTSRADKLAGVRCIITGKHAPEKRFGVVIIDEPVLAKGIVRYVGEPVAAVAAETADIAEEALDMIEVEYEELPAIFDGEVGMGKDPPAIIHPNMFNYQRVPAFGGPRLDSDRPNVFTHFKIRKGDVDAAFREADFVMENKFTTNRMQHAALEPHTVIAEPEADGGLTLWVGRQNIWRVRDVIGSLFELRPTQVRVIQQYVGGSFGSKVAPWEDPLVALLALKSLRPVKFVLNREEVFLHGGNRQPMIIHIKDGVKRNGTIIARKMKAILQSGAYSSNEPIVTKNCAFGAIGTYRMPHFKWDSYGVYTNEPPSCAYRGFGSVEVVFAVESQMDLIADRLRIDPVELRKKNILKEGEPNITGEITHSIGANQCLDEVAKFIKLDEKTKSEGVWRKGKGIGLGNKYSIAPQVSLARVKVAEDGTIILFHSADEIGQGCNTVMAQIAAEEFGISTDRVKVVFSDTMITPFFSGGSTGSRTTYQLGNAVRAACQAAKKKLFQRFAVKLEAHPDDLETSGGDVYVRGAPGAGLKITEVFMGYKGDRPGEYGAWTRGGEIIGEDTCVQEYTPENPETGQIDPEEASRGKRLVSFWAHMAKAVEVAVNVETGQVKVLRCCSAADMGQPMNPKMCEQQLEGGILMGIGDALYEEMKTHKGVVLNPNFTDYRVPTIHEMPFLNDVKSAIASVPHKEGPFGAKGVGEGAVIGMQSAIADAIYHAVGIRLKQLPMTPERVLKAIKRKGNSHR